MTYLQSLQAQSFPHIPKTQLAQLTDSAKMDIYENPSEHYASINNYGIAGDYIHEIRQKEVFDKCDLQDSLDQVWSTKRGRLDQISTATVSFILLSDHLEHPLCCCSCKY